MAGETIITVVGNLTDDPELKFTPSGAAVANFTVASTNRVFDKQSGDWREGDTLFLRCAAWRQLAENVAESLTKGTRVVVTGPLKVRQFERQDGSRGTSVEMNVDEIGPSLRYATAKVTKASRSGGGDFGGQNSGGGNSGGGAPAARPNNDAWSGGGQQAPAGGAADPWSGGASNEEPPF